MHLQIPKGTRDFSPEEKIVRDRIISLLKETFELYGYAPIETPLIEKYEILASKYAGGAEILKETFRLKDQGDRELGLRYDLTVPLARYIGMNPNTKMPFKRYQIGEVFRDGPVASARYRQFTQCDVDVVGSPTVAMESEILALISSAFSRLGFGIVLKINSRKLLNELLDKCGIEKELQDSVILSIDKLEKFGQDVVAKEMKELNIEDSKAREIIESVAGEGTNEENLDKSRKVLGESDGVKEVSQMLDYANNLGLDVVFDMSLARGLSYYTGIIIETFLRDSGVKSAVCAGGRYDRIIGSFLGKGEYPAVGVSFGLDRIYDAYLAKVKSRQKTNTQAYVIPLKKLKESMKIAQALRDSGINTDIDLAGKGPSKNLEYANSQGIGHVIFVGEKELGMNKLKLRDMESGKEEFLDMGDLVSRLRKDRNGK